MTYASFCRDVGPAVPMGCQAAVQLGPQAAETVLSRLVGEQPASITVGFAGQCISLGRRAGIFQLAHRNDRAIRLYLAGRLGANLKELVCWSTVKQLACETGHPSCDGWWVKDGKRPNLLRVKRIEARATD